MLGGVGDTLKQRLLGLSEAYKADESDVPGPGSSGPEEVRSFHALGALAPFELLFAATADLSLKSVRAKLFSHWEVGSEEQSVIARHWRGWTKRADADAYENLLKTRVLPELKTIEGYLGGTILRKDDSMESEFAVINYFGDA